MCPRDTLSFDEGNRWRNEIHIRINQRDDTLNPYTGGDGGVMYAFEEEHKRTNDKQV
jgi:hypothetical protein